MKRYLSAFIALVLLVVAAGALHLSDLHPGARLAGLSLLSATYVVVAVVFFMRARLLPSQIKTLLIAAFVLSAVFAAALALDAAAHASPGW
jgi:hypothetical protein